MALNKATPWSIEFGLVDQNALELLASRLALLAKARDVITLEGPLGIGKTVFARAFIHSIASGYGYKRPLVDSPTYTLVQVYDFPEIDVYHADLYRISSFDETAELGLEEAFDRAVTLIEWPDRMAGALPSQRLDLILSPGRKSKGRVVRMSGAEKWHDRLELLRNEK